MRLLDRFKVAASIIAGSWSWNGGTKSGHIWDGSKFKGALFYPSNWSLDTQALRERSRVAYWDSVQARSLLGRLVDNVIGTGLALESAPIWKLIGSGKNEEEQNDISREIELRFDLWAKSKEPDASGRMNLYELQGFEFLNRLRDGETIMVLRYSGDAARMNPLSIQFISPEQVINPTDKSINDAIEARGNRVIDGIEIDQYGREIAIYVRDGLSNKSTRITVFGPSGRRFVLHPLVSDTMGAVRGTPMLAPMIHELQKITDYTVAEIEAAVLNAVMAVWVKPGPDAPASRALAAIQTKSAAANTERSSNVSETSQAKFDKPGLIVQTLKAGEELQSFDTKRPNVNFGEFVRHITRHLSASIGVPIEVLEMSFNANYSASRASLLLFWTTVEKWRDATASQFLNTVYEAWFAEEVRSGRINAPGFNGASPVIRQSWINCSWLGISKPSIDPQKEATAVDMRIAQGATTREREAMNYNGSDYNENVRRLKGENERLSEANASMQKVSQTVATQPTNKNGEDDQQKQQQDDE